jgi:hypothetical protein
MRLFIYYRRQEGQFLPSDPSIYKTKEINMFIKMLFFKLISNKLELFNFSTNDIQIIIFYFRQVDGKPEQLHQGHEKAGKNHFGVFLKNF